ncbi:flagellar biosynthesis protein FlgD [Roseobacter sp. YSTF-M11]|uniref:Basal-body rod modification protein FlgD n=1 Tax=Roseobacter insulae TaxID=2859783 RepID=A0A9X1JZ89_9RHOB|nr:flagellar hook capping FlgD N-terminal domain-containing protein [Roseobacter insulae]MBW4706964.1 flagellar biosynthesis protein FlgD [Roseobacter insulae]
MEVTNSPATQAASAAASAPAQSAAVLSSDFETFLQMLTAQARYQDPLEPIDSSEYAAQLAQFSMVEQQVLSNDLLEALGSQLGAGNIAQMAGWIGMEARTTAPVSFDGAPVTVMPRSETGADEAILIIYNANGDEVQRRQIPTGPEPVEWAGLKDDGTPFDPGLYSFAVESRAVGKTIGTNAAETYARITEARRQGTDTVFILQGGSSVTSDDVAALRDPA